MYQNARWMREIVRLLPIRSQFILTGNINDIHIYSKNDKIDVINLHAILWKILETNEYKAVIRFNPVNGFSVFPESKQEEISKLLGIECGSYLDIASFREHLNRIVNHSERLAIVIEMASRIARDVENLSDTEYEFFRSSDKTARDNIPKNYNGTPFYNPVFWAISKRDDLPVWYGADNQKIITLDIEKPGYDARVTAAKLMLNRIHDYDTKSTQIDQYIKIFADLSEGLNLRDMQDIISLARASGLGMDDIDDAVRSYKTGDQALNSPWRSDGLKEKIQNAQKLIEKRVKGQKPAIEHAMDILKRSIMGLNGAHASPNSMRPRGVLFLAGPTGVGKTELAKALTESIFGSDDTYTRFDMSEFSAEHADARLIGAPPGYVGYETGGELTKAIRSKPFSLILFDEIEKAHPRILDKFLQILEDGRLTDGQGETVYFSESILVFTTNLGISKRNLDGSMEQLVRPGIPYEELKPKVLGAIEDHFKSVLGRPEILNRLGKNIIVYDFIQPDVAKEILNVMIANVTKRVQDEHKVELKLNDNAIVKLNEWCTSDLSNGGRGIGSMLEAVFVNPLARALFEFDDINGKKIEVTDIENVDHIYTVKLQLV
jgi:ATP-dependent Clp protease ATP-binding subunit ClpB